jgi:hypothetical protein
MPGRTERSADDTSPIRAPTAPGRMLAIADTLALIAFVVVGLRSHRIGAIAEIAARNAVPLAVAWIVVALVVGTYRRRDLASLVITWWVGSPQGGRIAVFLGVGMAFTLLFLLIGRGLVAALTRTRPVWRRP